VVARVSIFLFLLFVNISLTFAVPLSKQEIPIVVKGDKVSYDAQTHTMKAEGNVRIVYRDIKAFCGKAEVDMDTKVGNLIGKVKIEHPKGTIYGDKIRYNFAQKTASIDNLYLVSSPFYAGGKTAEKISDKKYVLKNGWFTTCNPQCPHFMDYRIYAKKIEFYPHDKMVAKNTVIKIGKVPILYLPYYMQPAKDKLPRVTIIPGKDHALGMYMLTAWRYYFNEEFKGRIHLDYYSKKGFGRGITNKYKSDRYGEGIAKIYYIADRDKLSFDEGVSVGSDRYKAQLRHRWQITPRDYLHLEIHKFSDKYFMKDYFYNEYQRDNQPLSYILLSHSFPYATASLLAQKRMNRFYSQTEYLPRLKLDVFRRKIGSSNFYFDSTTNLANLTYKNASPSDSDSDALRFDTHNIFTYQKRFAWLNVKPYIGIRNTFYSKSKFGDESLLRNIFETGIQFSTKLYKEFDKKIDFLGIKTDAIRHIITPILSYSYRHPPSVAHEELLQFDSIDEIDRENRIVFTLENRFKAKYKHDIWDLLYFAPSLSYDFKEENRGSHFTDLGIDLEFRPFADGSVYLENTSTYSVDWGHMKESTTDITFKGKLYQFTLGHRYIREETSQYTAFYSYQFNPKWQLNIYTRLEAKTGKFEKQQYYLRHDFHCWWLDVGIDVDRDKEYTFWVIMRIKAFPSIGINFSQSYKGPKDR